MQKRPKIPPGGQAAVPKFMIFCPKPSKMTPKINHVKNNNIKKPPKALLGMKKNGSISCHLLGFSFIGFSSSTESSSFNPCFFSKYNRFQV